MHRVTGIVLSSILVLFISYAALAQTPVIDPNRIYNSASFTPTTQQPVAQGSLLTIFGSNFASTNSVNSTIPFPLSLGGLSVSVNGVIAPVSLVVHDPVNGDQVNIQVPWDALPVLPPGTSGAVQVVVNQSGNPSFPATIPITAAAPGVFAIQLDNQGRVTGYGTGQAIAYGNSDYQFAAPPNSIAGYATHPAQINDPNTLIVLATGLGPVSPPVNSGSNANDGQLHHTTVTPDVLVGGVPAQVVFSGLSPLYVGVYQLNIILQPGTPTGNAVPLQIRTNGITTTSKVTIAVSE
jgi:uncharacterized protein (TIGR03437 family)